MDKLLRKLAHYTIAMMGEISQKKNKNNKNSLKEETFAPGCKHVIFISKFIYFKIRVCLY